MAARKFNRIEFHIAVATFDDGYFFIVMRIPYTRENLLAVNQMDNVTEINLIK